MRGRSNKTGRLNPTAWLNLLAGLVVGALCVIAPAKSIAANESVSIRTGVTPMKGSLYREYRVPVQSSIEATVTVPAGQSSILPLKQTLIRFDTDMTFNPHNDVTPVCPESQVGPQSNLASGISFMVDKCPHSVIGTATSLIYLFKQTSAPLFDPQMVIFNNGRTPAGNPSIKIYAYSKGTATGILMHGSLLPNGDMTVDVPVLSYDSAVGSFLFNMPGTGMEVPDEREPDGFRTIKGQDPNYVKARCSDGLWTSGATFSLGERDPATGADTGPTSKVDAPDFNDPCVGLPGREKLTGVRKQFPGSARRGSRPAFRVTVKNRGTATARRVKLVASGGARGSRRVANIPPGATRNLVIRPRITGRRGRRAKVNITVRSQRSTARFSARVRVR